MFESARDLLTEEQVRDLGRRFQEEKSRRLRG